ncbi:hypothetical protein LSH36_364g05006 [Paralvinella palmiformis]|uniref:Ig-like domain-containing protein n=1 Tax=Paralvinella palmiformis TaxID=53620 RepID=A0AAD9MZR1_9ANNE|nr:hypothetical protein LSH36_364g05006 [Paralvinella palmiformis]
MCIEFVYLLTLVFLFPLSAKPPKARVIPREQEVQRGKKINLKCKISGRPLPIVRWLKDNKPLVNSGRIRIRNSK